MEETSSLEDTDMNSMEYLLKRSVMSKSKLAIILKDEDGSTQYCCVECPLRYTEKEDLEKHLCTHFREYKHLCGICGTGLKRKEHLDRHTLEHQEVRPHICPVCGKGFKRKEHLNIHKSIHSGEKGQVCTLCQKSFYRKDHLQKHLQTHSKVFTEQNMTLLEDDVTVKHEITDDQWAVDDHVDMKPLISDVIGNYCEMLEVEVKIEPQETQDDDMQDEQFESQDSQGSSDVDWTIRKSKNKVKRPFTCCVCHKSYKRKDHLKIHSWTHLKKDKICSECGEGFHKDEQLLAHMNKHLREYTSLAKSEEETQMEQDNLGPEEQYIIDEYTPRKIYEETGQRPHECLVCHRKFKRKQHLKVHANVHLKHQATVCSLCNEAFQTVSQLENHVCSVSPRQEQNELTNGVNVDEEPHRQNTPREAKKENKLPEDYGEMIQDDSIQDDCIQDDCIQDDCIQEQSLNIKIVHEESEIPVPQRVYVCKYCNKPFKRKDHYRIHLHIHTGVKSFFCPHCGKGFYRKDHMQKHVLIHKPKPKPKKELPDLFPIHLFSKATDNQQLTCGDEIKPEITIHAPARSKLRVPLQIKVPYQMVVSLDNGEQRALTVDPNLHSPAPPPAKPENKYVQIYGEMVRPSTGKKS